MALHVALAVSFPPANRGSVMLFSFTVRMGVSLSFGYLFLG